MLSHYLRHYNEFLTSTGGEVAGGSGTGTLTFSNPGTMLGEFDVIVNVSDDNWADDP